MRRRRRRCERGASAPENTTSFAWKTDGQEHKLVHHPEIPKPSAVLCAGEHPFHPSPSPAAARRASGRVARAMQDPFFAVKEEVEHSVTVVTQLHTKWEELRDTKHGGDEFE